ncbi:hypothetical protein PIB30_102832, partial [Stylosanthes scabra]|nr:hypothetical protein [Stylosanthes scabra]
CARDNICDDRKGDMENIPRKEYMFATKTKERSKVYDDRKATVYKIWFKQN